MQTAQETAEICIFWRQTSLAKLRVDAIFRREFGGWSGGLGHALRVSRSSMVAPRWRSMNKLPMLAAVRHADSCAVASPDVLQGQKAHVWATQCDQIATNEPNPNQHKERNPKQ